MTTSDQALVAGFSALAMLVAVIPAQAGGFSFSAARSFSAPVRLYRGPSPAPAAVKPAGASFPTSAAQKAAVSAQASRSEDGGANFNGRGNAPPPISRFGSNTVPVAQTNNWFLWYLILSGSNNHHGVTFSRDITSNPDYEVVRFTCEPRPGQTAWEWQNECKSDSGPYQLRMNKQCYQYAGELAKNRIERCATHFRPDF